MIDSIINSTDPKNSDAIIFTAAYDQTASGNKGAVNGPKKIIECLDRKLEFYDRFTKDEPAYLFKISHVDIENINNLTPEDMVSVVSETYESNYNQNIFPILLGGEHSISFGSFTALANHHKSSDVTIVHIDAHFDLRNDDFDYNDVNPSKYAHSCVMRRAHELGYNILSVGIRTSSKAEYEYAQKNIKFFEWGIGSIPTYDEILNSITTEKVYLSIDVDGIDPAHMPGTGTPVQGGLEWNYAIKLIREIFQRKSVIAADIMEVSPRNDDMLTEYGAAQLCYMMISDKLHNK